MELIKSHPVEFIGVLILILEQALPYIPIKANSSLQVIINLAKAILGKKG